MLRFLVPALLICSLAIAGCSPQVEPKTQDPAEIEKGRQQAIQNSNRELQGPQPPPAPMGGGVPAN